jgi:hypothetical protein
MSATTVDQKAMMIKTYNAPKINPINEQIFPALAFL